LIPLQRSLVANEVVLHWKVSIILVKQILGHSVYLLSRFVIWQDFARSDALMTAKITTSCHVTSSCSLAEIYRVFGEIRCCILYCRRPIS